ncbi:MAG: hypothetical protein J5495_02570 [Bacteroidales bacterium]|nr:hypothetical protein [Bacteroidales bacterium]
MKRLSAIIAVLALSLAGLQATAQELDKQLFNHVSLGVTAGVDGVGLDVVVPASPYLHIRGGYSIFPYKYKTNVNLGVYERDDAYDLDLKNLPIAVGLWRGGVGKLLLDIYPGSQTVFRFVAGAYIGNGKIVAGTADFRSVLEPGDYRTGVGYNDIDFSTDDKGYLYVDVAGLKALPYLGIGLGRPLNPEKRVTFSFELGAFYTGGTKVQTYDYSFNPKGEVSVITSKNLNGDDGKPFDGGYVGKLSSIPVLPMLRLGLYVRLF